MCTRESGAACMLSCHTSTWQCSRLHNVPTCASDRRSPQVPGSAFLTVYRTTHASASPCRLPTACACICTCARAGAAGGGPAGAAAAAAAGGAGGEDGGSGWQLSSLGYGGLASLVADPRVHDSTDPTSKEWQAADAAAKQGANCAVRGPGG